MPPPPLPLNIDTSRSFAPFRSDSPTSTYALSPSLSSDFGFNGGLGDSVPFSPLSHEERDPRRYSNSTSASNDSFMQPLERARTFPNHLPGPLNHGRVSSSSRRNPYPERHTLVSAQVRSRRRQNSVSSLSSQSSDYYQQLGNSWPSIEQASSTAFSHTPFPSIYNPTHTNVTSQPSQLDRRGRTDSYSSVYDSPPATERPDSPRHIVHAPTPPPVPHNPFVVHSRQTSHSPSSPSPVLVHHSPSPPRHGHEGPIDEQLYSKILRSYSHSSYGHGAVEEVNGKLERLIREIGQERDDARRTDMARVVQVYLDRLSSVKNLTELPEPRLIVSIFDRAFLLFSRRR
ncbi:uncharacterized protein JCM6883_002480 [Sporobolomyces salmoneus]|uniref:uncharacterized protein n=1 Tax=Sporobolomyces salmoneus TaxID=183962 RepID=UPI00317C1781